jgi:hypothetical protein
MEALIHILPECHFWPCVFPIGFVGAVIGAATTYVILRYFLKYQRSNKQ